MSNKRLLGLFFALAVLNVSPAWADRSWTVGAAGGGSGLPSDPPACAANQYAVDQDVNGTLICTQPTEAQIVNTPAGNIAATTGQAAINELDAEKQPLAAALTTVGGKTVVGTGTDLRLSTGAYTANDCVKVDTNGNFSTAGAACGSGGGGTPGGSTTQVQYNNAGVFAGSAGLTLSPTVATLPSPVVTGTLDLSPAVLKLPTAGTAAVGTTWFDATNQTLRVGDGTVSRFVPPLLSHASDCTSASSSSVFTPIVGQLCTNQSDGHIWECKNPAAGGVSSTLCDSPGDWQDTRGSGTALTIQDEAAALTQRAILNFSGAGVSCVDNSGATRTDCTIAGGGSTTDASLLTSGLLPAARLTNTQTVGDANATISAGTRDVLLTAALTAPRTYTLPAASGYPAGYRITFSDVAGGVTTTNTATLTRAGADTINGATTVVLSTANAAPVLITDGTSKWNLDIRGVSRGGTGAVTAQAAINTLSNVAAATNEFVLTKDTGTGNAVFKASTGGTAIPGGTSGQVQYNNAGVMGGSSGMTLTPTVASLAAPIITGTVTPTGVWTFQNQVNFDNLGVTFDAQDTNPACTANVYGVYADLSEQRLKKCQNGTLTDLDAASGTWSLQNGYDASGTSPGITLGANGLKIFGATSSSQSFGICSDGACTNTNLTYYDAANTRWVHSVTPASDLAFIIPTTKSLTVYRADGTTALQTTTEAGTITTSSSATINDGGAAATTPNKSGTALPGTCTVGQTYFKTDATAGQNQYGCTATNTWTAQGGGGSFSGDVTGAFSLSGDISPTQLTADQNNYSPASLATASVVRLTSDKVVALTGIVAATDGRILPVANIGNFPIQLLKESASSTAANRFAFAEDITVLPTATIVLIYDTTASRWRPFTSGVVGASVDPASHILLYDDFFGSSVLGNMQWLGSGYGSGAVVVGNYGVDATQKALGVTQLKTAAAVSSGAVYIPGTSVAGNVVPSLGPMVLQVRVAVETLSTSTDEFTFTAGLHDASGAAGTNVTDGVYFRYDRAVDGDFWEYCTAAAAARTCTASTFAVTTGYVWLMAITDATWSTVSFFGRVTGGATWTFLGTTTTNIPSGAQLSWPEFKMDKTVGTALRAADVDVFYLNYAVKR